MLVWKCRGVYQTERSKRTHPKTGTLKKSMQQSKENTRLLFKKIARVEHLFSLSKVELLKFPGWVAENPNTATNYRLMQIR